MTDHAAEHESRALAWHGLTPSPALACPRVAAGLRCEWDWQEPRCVCQRHRRLLEHVRMWAGADGRLTLTAEPYSLDGGLLGALLADLAGLGLEVIVSARSMWHPGSTLLILARGTWPAAADRPPRDLG